MKNKIKFLVIIFIAFSIILFLSFYIYKWEFRKPLLEVNFLSLNRGRSIFLRTPNNKTILIGGGQNLEVIREITKLIPFYRRKIDYVFIPSANKNQIGGLLEIVSRYDVDEVLIGEEIATSTVLDKLKKEIIKNKIHIKKIKKGDVLDIDDVSIEVIFPYKGFKFNKTSLPELGLYISYKDSGIFLIGNLSKTIQKNINKDLEIITKDNLLEFYNSASDSKVDWDLMGKIKPRFTFSTKEKTSRWNSDGDKWISQKI